MTQERWTSAGASRARSCTTRAASRWRCAWPALDRPQMLEQWFKMGEATNLEQFKDALRVMSVPMWHANYADDQGHIMFVFDGLVPKRKGHDYDYWTRSCRRYVGDDVDRLLDVRRAAEGPSIRRAAGTRTPTSRPGTSRAAARSHEICARTSRRRAWRCRRCERPAFETDDHRGSERSATTS